MGKTLRWFGCIAILAGLQSLGTAAAFAQAVDFDQGTGSGLLQAARSEASAMPSVAGGAAVPAAQGSAPAVNDKPFAGTVVAPYFDIGRTPPPGSEPPGPTTGLMDAHQKAGLDHAILFLGAVAASGDCPDISQGRQDILDDVRAFAALGSDLMVSISGETCGETPGKDLADVLSDVIHRTGAHGIDFDVEDNYVASRPDTDRRIAAILELKKRFPDLFVSFTLSATPGVDYNTDPSQAGLNSAAYALVKATLAGGVKIDRINVMTFSWGFSKATLAQYPQYKLAEMTAESVAQQMQALFSPNPHELVPMGTIYSMLGVTACIGLGDEPVPFYPSDALRLGAYAREKGLGLISYYQFQMDRSQDRFGGRDENGAATKAWLDDFQDRYSGVPQQDFEFLRAFEGVAPASRP